MYRLRVHEGGGKRLASYPGRAGPGEGKSGLVYTVCACVKSTWVFVIFSKLFVKQTVNDYVNIVSCPFAPCRGRGMAFDDALSSLKQGDIVLKKEQREAIKLLYQCKDVFLWLPTGFGKSICFQVIPFYLTTSWAESSLPYHSVVWLWLSLP